MSFLPSFELVTAASASPDRWMLVLHGILGSGGNLRPFASRLAAAHPGWGFVLVDLRMHGRSQGAPPPHTLATTAGDLRRLAEHLALPIAGVMGHSFGGKAALAYAAQQPLELSFVLDASPGALPGGASDDVRRTLCMLRRVPAPLPSRARFFEIVAREGYPRAVAEWLAMNVRRSDDGFRLRLDLDAIEALVDDYHAADLWHVLERPPARSAFHVVIAEASPAIDDASRGRLAAIAAREPRVMTHLLTGAGHWVHVDAPDALFAIVSAGLGER